jgi:hypothetical protein
VAGQLVVAGVEHRVEEVRSGDAALQVVGHQGGGHAADGRERPDTVGESFEANKSINWAGNRRQSSLNPYGLAEGAGLRSDTDVDASKRF